MSHAVLLRFEIADVVGVGSHLNGYILDNLQTVGLQTDALDGVVGQQCTPIWRSIWAPQP